MSRERAGRPRVLFVASEAYPLVKTGGLGDVAGALPGALRAQGVDARALLPGYPAVVGAVRGRRVARAVEPLPGWPRVDLVQARMPDAAATPLYVIDCPDLYARDGGPYADAGGAEWPDNALRFGMLARVAALLASPETPLRWRPEVLHCHDWQGALAAAYVALDARRPCRTVVTVHNIAFPGSFDPAFVPRLALPWSGFAMNGFEFHGRLSFLKAGLYYADVVTTVSPGYAREIRTEAFGGGFHGLLAGRGDALVGILNGIDDREWDPSTDAQLPRLYGVDDLEGKRECARALEAAAGLAPDARAPLLGMVTRLTHQKGVDLVPAALDRLGAAAPRLVVLGTGDRRIEEALRALAAARPGRVGFVERYDEALAHLVYAGADAFLMPSRFEPCGLAQMYAMRYGTPPIARRTGGLADTVVAPTREALAAGAATGFLFDDASPQALAAALGRALEARADPGRWRALQLAGMTRDFGWPARAREYRDLYRRIAVAA